MTAAVFGGAVVVIEVVAVAAGVVLEGTMTDFRRFV